MTCEVNIWTLDLPPQLNEQQIKYCYQLLGDREKERYEKMGHERRRVEYLLGHTLARVKIGQRFNIKPQDLPLIFEPVKGKIYEKPCLHILDHPNFDFSLSHCQNRVVCALAPCPVGIDIEDWNQERKLGLENALKNFPEKEEVLSLKGEAALHRYYEYWTLKEALHKATGYGFLNSQQDTRFRIKEDGEIDFEFDDKGVRAESGERKAESREMTERQLDSSTGRVINDIQYKLLYPTPDHVIGLAVQTLDELDVCVEKINEGEITKLS